uniref:Transferrin receptor-like dimerisation domain-containing protein n=1 Tax=Aegilops tauschii subsp. strangulata TaxID=200361 RepID=A0A453FFZ9_AEGTS
MRIRGLNDRLMQAERAFTNREGIFKQAWYKHLVSQQLVYTFIFSGIHRGIS